MVWQEGNTFCLFVSSQRSYSYPWGVPGPQPLVPGPFWGGQDRSSSPRKDRGTHGPGQGVHPHWTEEQSACYVAGGTPLAVSRQEDWLSCFHVDLFSNDTLFRTYCECIQKFWWENSNVKFQQMWQVLVKYHHPIKVTKYSAPLIWFWFIIFWQTNQIFLLFEEICMTLCYLNFAILLKEISQTLLDKLQVKMSKSTKTKEKKTNESTITWEKFRPTKYICWHADNIYLW